MRPVRAGIPSFILPLVLLLTGCDLLSPTPKPAALVFSVEPAGAAGGAPFATQPAVRVQDADGHDIGGESYAVTITLGVNSGAAHLAGTRTVTSVAGVASFTNLSIDAAGSGYTLVASLDSISTTSTAFDVEVGPAAALRFAAQPQGGWDTGAPLDSQPSVEIVDAGGNRITTAEDTVGLSIGANPSGATLLGTTTQVATAGVAAFTGLSVNRSGTGYTLVASATGRSSAASAPFTIRRWTGQIEVATTTTGLNLDPDGYTARVDDGPPGTLPVNGSALLDSLSPSTHHVSLSGAAFNCALADTAADVSVQSGVASQLAVTAVCRRYLSDEVLITTDEFGSSEVAVMNPDGSAEMRLTYQGGVAPRVSPDGLTIAFASRRSGNGYGIYLMNADGTGVRELVQRSSFDGSPAWSPDGTRLAFRSETDGPYGAYGRIWVVNADGTGLRQVSPDVDSTTYVYDDSPDWFPDGHRVVYTRSGLLYIVDVDQGVVTPLGGGSFGGEEPRVSPDGSKIAFSASVGGNYDIYVVDVGGSSPVRLTTDSAQDGLPVWSPDGTQILFARVANGTFHVYTMHVGTGGGTPVGTVTAWGELPDDWAKAK